MKKSVYISQKELAEFLGCTQQYIGKLKKKGLFDDVLENNKFLRSKSGEYVKIYEDSKDETRENQREANLAKKTDIKKIDTDNNKSTSCETDMFDVSYISDTAQRELNELLLRSKSSVQKIQIKDAFIESKSKELDFKKHLGTLITLSEAEELIELIAINLRDKMFALPSEIKNKYININNNHLEFMKIYINNVFDEFNKFGIEDVKS